MTSTIDNTDDLIDSRDVIARLYDLDSQIADIEEKANGDDPTSVTADYDELREERRVLRALANEAIQYADDWEYGATLIRDSYFTDYAMQLAEDIGAVKENAQWPYNFIDWTMAAHELRSDYTPVDFGGVTYWVR